MRDLGPLESAVMKLLWAADGPLGVRQVVERLHERELAYTTVATVLDKLHRKEWVQRDRIGRGWYYLPKVEPGEHAAHLMLEALADSPDPRATFHAFLDGIGAEEAETLRQLLGERPPE